MSGLQEKGGREKELQNDNYVLFTTYIYAIIPIAHLQFEVFATIAG